MATFAWLGLTLRADSLPLASAELDGEARCLLTDHGAFVLFNVYVPNSAVRRLPFKLRWLSAGRALELAPRGPARTSRPRWRQ